MIKEKLQIYIITYNRIQKFKYTLDELLKSPIKDFDITILDNASTDGTSELIQEYCRVYSNITHIRHHRNIGGNANICRAFEMGANCNKEYFWIICDDDKYDFSNWSEVVNKVNEEIDVICVSDYAFASKPENKIKPEYQIFQLTFVPAGIYKSSLITDDVLVNMYDSIITMFQQLVVSIKCVNENKKIHVLSKPIVLNGRHFDDKLPAEFVSYKRGGNECWVLERRENTIWCVGYSQILSLVKDESLKKKCVAIAFPYSGICGNWNNFYNSIQQQYIKTEKLNYFLEIYPLLPDEQKNRFSMSEIFSFALKDTKNEVKNCPVIEQEKLNFFEKIIYIKNEKNHKVINLFGLKIKLKRK